MDDSADKRIEIYNLLIKKITNIIENMEKKVDSMDELDKNEKKTKVDTLNKLKKEVECIEVNCNGDRDLRKFIQNDNDTIIQIMYPNKTHGMKGMEL